MNFDSCIPITRNANIVDGHMLCSQYPSHHWTNLWNIHYGLSHNSRDFQWFTNIFPSNRVLKWSPSPTLRQIHIATSKKIEKTYHYNYNCRILFFPIFFPLFDLEIAALLEKSMRLLDEQIPLEIFMLGFTTCVSSRTPNSKNGYPIHFYHMGFIIMNG